ncbi:transmembrane protein 192 isoform X3 [Uranotaenia lowii]|uniref:transmembrane protein 192 isoform X2 n=1 Tax=Uranotaenia lowii TaxID=190385 RepID=UPI00247A2CCF|nr:transmembrane protein 192 isoform X2 [Uranotaenia lowii]XP_055585762.1 transmembrane protein 192 isoform X3 [Uranotaenia lowii]
MGGRFFDDSSTRMDDHGGHHTMLDPILATEDDDGFRPLKTVPAFSVHLLISSCISLTGIVLAATWEDSRRCEAYFIMLYLRAAFWLITFLFDQLVHRRHEQLRLDGYHDFHRSTTKHKSIPLQIVSLWNTFLLAIQALIQHYYGDHFAEKCIIVGWLSPIVYVTLFCSMETLTLSLVNGTYIAKVVRFNRAAAPPDALQGCRGHSGGSLGLTQHGLSTTELLEKQADLINYLKDHNLKLNQKIMQMNAQVRTVTFPG